jgi:hypothetical protein
MTGRLTEAELRALEAKDPNDMGEDRWPVREVQRFGAEVRRLRGLITSQATLVEELRVMQGRITAAPGRSVLLAEASKIGVEQALAYLTKHAPEFFAEASAIREKE